MSPVSCATYLPGSVALTDSVRVSCLQPGPDKYTAMFSTDDASIFGEELVSDPDNFAFFSRFMVHQNFRRVRTEGFGLACALYAACFAAVRRRGAKILLLNCTPALAPYYERFGFVRYKPAYSDVGGMGLQIPLAMPLEDTDFLWRVAPKSPLTLAALHCTALLHHGGRSAAAASEPPPEPEAEAEAEAEEAEAPAEAPALSPSSRWLAEVQARR